MKFFRYSAPSLKTITGITYAKKAINKAVGIPAAMKPVRFLGNAKRSLKRHAGYYGTAGNPLERTSMTQRAFAMRRVLEALRETPNPRLEPTAETRGGRVAGR